MTNEALLGDERNHEMALRIRLAVIEDIIANLRKEKSSLKRGIITLDSNVYLRQ